MREDRLTQSTQKQFYFVSIKILLTLHYENARKTVYAQRPDSILTILLHVKGRSVESICYTNVGSVVKVD